MTETRMCSQCKQIKKLEEFNKGRTECRVCSQKIWKERYDATKGKFDENLTHKICKGCNQLLPISEFQKKAGSRDGYNNKCKICTNKDRLEWRHNTGRSKTPSRTHAWNVRLGNEIGEKVAARYFVEPIQMPYNNPGYDLICKNGHTIDVKCAIANNNRWNFSIKHNKIPDYFILIAFDSKENLQPQHIWLIPGSAIINNKLFNSRSSFSVSLSTCSKIAQYEKPVEKLECCCQSMATS